MHARILNHLRRHVIAYLALTLALTGTAYAMGRNTVGAKEVAPNSVGSSELKKGAVGASEVANGSLGAPEMSSNSVCNWYGQILLLAFDDFAPVGTLTANGSTHSIEKYDDLFNVYGTQYGGDGQTDFGLPNIPAPLPGTQYVVCTVGSYPEPSN